MTISRSAPAFLFILALALTIGGCAKQTAAKLDGLWSGKRGQGSITFTGENFQLNRDFPPGGRADVSGSYTFSDGQLTLNAKSADAPTGDPALSDTRKTEVLNAVNSSNPLIVKWDSDD